MSNTANETMAASPAAKSQRRSLIGKFRNAALVQALLIFLISMCVFLPMLYFLSQEEQQQREATRTAIVDADVNNIARLLAMDLGAPGSLPLLWENSDKLEIAMQSQPNSSQVRTMREEIDGRHVRLNGRISDKISYNGVLLDLIVCMPRVDPRTESSPFLFPIENQPLKAVTMDDILALNPITRLTRIPQLEEDDQVRQSSAPRIESEELAALGNSPILRYLQERARELSGEAYLMPIRREAVPYGFAGIVVKTDLIGQQLESNWEKFWGQLQSRLWLLGGITLLSLGLGVVLVHHRAERWIRPLESMRVAVEDIGAKAAGAIATSDLRDASSQLAGIAVDTRDEIGALRNSFIKLSLDLAETLQQKADALSNLRDSMQQLRRTDRLRLVGTLTYGLAHNLNNALAPIANVAHAATLRHPEDQKLGAMMSMVLDSVKRSSDIVRRLRDLTRAGSGEPVRLQVNSVIDESIESVSREMSQTKIQVQTDLGELPKIYGNPVELWEVFTNLLVNAREAMLQDPNCTSPKVILRSRWQGGVVRVEVQDNGPGMSPEVLKRSTEPFFSTKGRGEASGIGLWISDRIVAEHGGTLEIQSAPQQGTTVVVTLKGMHTANLGIESEESST